MAILLRGSYLMQPNEKIRKFENHNEKEEVVHFSELKYKSVAESKCLSQ